MQWSHSPFSAFIHCQFGAYLVIQTKNVSAFHRKLDINLINVGEDFLEAE